MKYDEVYKKNKIFWEQQVAEKCGFTRPWLDIDPGEAKKYAAGKVHVSPDNPLADMYPCEVLADVKGKNVLCLAAGGGQQSAVFGLLGALVTVVDISERQLMGDKKAAEHYGYTVVTIQSDLSDLSFLEGGSFDIVYQAPSIGYIPDILSLYGEVARITKSGGIFRADAYNPIGQFVDDHSWDGNGYRISIPYAVKEKQRSKDEEVIEFRHYLDETFNGLINSSFVVEKVAEMPEGLWQGKDPKPGTWPHQLLYIPGHFAILARKKQ